MIVDRRRFLKQSAMLAAAAASHASFPSVTAALDPAINRPFGIPGPGETAARDSRGEQGFYSLPQDATTKRGSDHSFFTQAKHRPEVIAHRGGTGQWPGETLYAFEQAAKIGVDVLEMDVHSTRDGALVLMHNRTVNETTDGTGRVREMSLNELKRLDAGYRWSADGGKTFPFRGKGIEVATLEEVFKAFPRMRMNIEIKQSKPSLVEPIAKMIRDYDMADKVLVASFWDRVMDDFQDQFKRREVATSASTPELLEFVARKNYVPNADALQVKDKVLAYRVINKSFVERARRNNLPVHAWTVNDLEGMRRMIALGVDGIITDYPGPLLALLGRTAPA